MNKNCYLAIDIGASSGRHIIGFIKEGKITLEEIYRFENSAETVGGHLCWNIESIFDNVVEGIAECRKKGFEPETVAIDTWGVDFVLLDKNKKLLGNAVSYRDGRTQKMDESVNSSASEEELYGRTGIQKQIFNTIYQLEFLKKNEPEILEKAQHFLMIPEYLNFLLTGEIKNEYTNATTTNLVNAKTKQWDLDLIKKLGFNEKLFSNELSLPGETVGNFKAEIAEKTGFNSKVILCASHDTASAFLSVPALDENAVYISSGTWSLLGVENKNAITTEESRKANFTNEGGYKFRYRYLKNIMGLWIIQNCKKNWNGKYSFAELENLARESKIPGSAVIDINKQRFLAPQNMVEEIIDECRTVHKIELKNPGDIMKCVYQSLAENYRNAMNELSELTQKKFTSINIVGGGSKDDYLNELTAKKAGLKVLAGPTEGTALGNLMVQFLNSGEFKNLQEARDSIRKSFNIKQF